MTTSIYPSIPDGGVYCSTGIVAESPWFAACEHFCHWSPIECCVCAGRDGWGCTICKAKKEKSIKHATN